MVRTILIGAAALLLTACGGHSATSVAPTPTYPVVAGTYTNGTNLFQFTLTRVADNAVARLNCGGTVTLTGTGPNIAGSFIMRDGDCGSPGSGSLTGTLATDGGFSAQTSVQGSDPNLLTAIFGCLYVSGSQGYNGAISGRTLDITATLTMQCPVDGRVLSTVRITGSR